MDGWYQQTKNEVDVEALVIRHHGDDTVVFIFGVVKSIWDRAPRTGTHDLIP